MHHPKEIYFDNYQLTAQYSSNYMVFTKKYIKHGPEMFLI